MAETKTINTAKSAYYTSDGTKLYLSATTEVKVFQNGKFVPNSTKTTLKLDDGSVLATLESSERWEYTDKAGADLRRTLSNRNSMMNINLRNRLRTDLARSDDTIKSGGSIDKGINDGSTATKALGGASIPQATPEEKEQEDAELEESPETTIDLDGEIVVNIEGNNVRTAYPTLYYPEDLATNKQDTIKFSMRTNEGSIIRSGLGVQNIERRAGTPISGSVTLPIPSGIQDTNAVNFNEGELNPFQAFLVAGSMNLMNNEANQLADTIGNIFGKVAKTFKENQAYGNALKLYLAQEATSTQGLLSRASGAILNPNLELLFNKPMLRDFRFVFRMSPRDSSEANSVKQIIRFFKQGMSVKSTADATFLKSPNVFDIKYQAFKNDGVRGDHQSIGKIKTCALMNCTVNYTPDGSYMTYTDNERTLTSYEVELQFKELTPLIEDDYRPAGVDIAGIGF